MLGGYNIPKTMKTSPATIEFILDQLKAIKNISARKMFGEYALYCEGILIGLVCENTLYIKASEEGRRYIEDPEYGSPYPGAKLAFKITDKIDDDEWLCGLVIVSTKELENSVIIKPGKRTSVKKARKSS